MAKILQLSKYYYPEVGGIELVAKNISKAHRSIGDLVHVICFSDKKEEVAGPYQEKIIRLKKDFVIFSAPMTFSCLKDLENIFSFDYDKIYVHLPNPFMHEVIRYFFKKRKSHHPQIVSVYHSDIVNKGWAGHLYQFYFSLTDSIYKKHIVSSLPLIQSSKYLSSINKNLITVINFPCEEINSPLLRTQFNQVVLAIGRLVPYKGFDFLIKALANTSYQVYIVGDGPQKKRLEDLIIKFKASNIILTGLVSEDEKQQLIKKAGVLINCSLDRAEAYGLTIVEAFENGLPVLASDINSGVSFLVRKGINGDLFPVGESEKLKELLKLLAQDSIYYESLSKGARSFYLQNLSFDIFKKLILEN